MTTDRRTIAITGATRGLGLHMAKQFLAKGDRVIAVCRTKPELLETWARESGCRDNLINVQADMANLDRLNEVVRRMEEQTSCDVLINNAAVAHRNLLLMQSPEQITETITINLLAPVLLCRAMARYMMRRRSGRIINISSIVSTRVYRGLTVYGASKAGIEQFTRGLANELAPFNVYVNAIAPGVMDTDMSASLSKEQLDISMKRTPIGRMVKVEEITAAVNYLLSDEASATTGQTLTIDGGINL
jgi:3-oxoacyl-[acyl-carrier protein] reductase